MNVVISWRSRPRVVNRKARRLLGVRDGEKRRVHVTGTGVFVRRERRATGEGKETENAFILTTTTTIHPSPVLQQRSHGARLSLPPPPYPPWRHRASPLNRRIYTITTCTGWSHFVVLTVNRRYFGRDVGVCLKTRNGPFRFVVGYENVKHVERTRRKIKQTLDPEPAWRQCELYCGTEPLALKDP